MTTPQRDRIVLACSGGLDISVALGGTAEQTVAQRLGDQQRGDERVAP